MMVKARFDCQAFFVNGEPGPEIEKGTVLHVVRTENFTVNGCRYATFIVLIDEVEHTVWPAHFEVV